MRKLQSIKRRMLSIQGEQEVSSFHLTDLNFLEIANNHGTSELLDIGSTKYKRHTSLMSRDPEKVVEITENWKSKNRVDASEIKQQSSYERIFIPASNVERKKEEGCMNKLKIERT